MIGSGSKIARLSLGAKHHIEAEQVIVDLASVVKELVENSIDAKSSCIEVTFVNFGLDEIIFQDNGDGISLINMKEIASSRYATSKIASDTDLERSESYGFRGEALHSVVKLAERVSIYSSPDSSGSGHLKLFSDFGEKTDFASKARRKGTTVSIEGLFQAVSVRRLDWLKRKGAIFAQAIFLLQSYAVLLSSIKFKVDNMKDGSRVCILSTSGVDSRTAFLECFSNSAIDADSFSSVSIVAGYEVKFDGIFVKNREKGKNRFVLFVNNRPFESPKLQRLIQQTLKKIYCSGVEIFANIGIPMLWVDYNVSPDKRSMYILNEPSIMRAFLDNLEEMVQKSHTAIPSSQEPPRKDMKHATDLTQRTESTEVCHCEELWDLGSADSVKLLKEDILKLNPLGQFNNGFIICSKTDGMDTELFAVDQHAADERIRFEEIVQIYPISSQKLVLPIKISLPTEDEDILTHRSDVIEKCGFIVSQKADYLYYLNAVPMFHGAHCTIEDFYELVDYLKDHGVLYRNLCPKLHRILASRACRSAVMIGTPQTMTQMQNIIKKLSETQYPWICAHGRPTIQFLKRLGSRSDFESK